MQQEIECGQGGRTGERVIQKVAARHAGGKADIHDIRLRTGQLQSTKSE
jgi:hypothetical protein